MRLIAYLETDMDQDLERMSREELIAEAKRLRAGIRAHRDKLGMSPRGTFSLDGSDHVVLSYRD